MTRIEKAVAGVAEPMPLEIECTDQDGQAVGVLSVNSSASSHRRLLLADDAVMDGLSAAGLTATRVDVVSAG